MLDELFESERTKMLAVRVCGRRVVARRQAGYQSAESGTRDPRRVVSQVNFVARRASGTRR